jgi:peroxiredoxin
VELLADKNGGLVRLLGLEIGTPENGLGPKCQRYAAVVEDGVLLKLVGGSGWVDGWVSAGDVHARSTLTHEGLKADLQCERAHTQRDG